MPDVNKPMEKLSEVQNRNFYERTNQMNSPLEEVYRNVSESNPATVGKTLDRATRLLVDPRNVEADPEGAEKAMVTPRPSYWHWMETHRPKTSQYLLDPQSMAVAHDIIPEQADRENVFQEWAHGTKQNLFQVSVSTAGWEQTMAYLSNDKEAIKKSKAKEAKVQKWEAELQRLAETAPQGLKPVYNIANQGMNTLFSLGKSAERAVQFGGAFASAGAFYGTLAGPEATLPTAAAAGTVGLKVGAYTGLAESAMMLEAGAAFREISKLKITTKDKNGKDVTKYIDPRKAAQYALTVGLINAGFETAGEIAQFKLLKQVPGLKKIFSVFGSGKVKELVAKRTMKGAVLKGVVDWIKTGAFETGTEMAQQVASWETTQRAKESIGLERAPVEEGVKEVFSVVSPTLQATMLNPLTILGLGFQVRHNSQQIHEAQRDAAIYTQTGQEAQQSQLMQRVPEKFRQLLQYQTEGTPMENVYIDVDALTTYLQENVPGKPVDESLQIVADELGLGEELAEAVETGGVIRVPFAEWVVKTATSQLYDGMAPHVKFSPDGVTLAESQTVNQHMDAIIGEEIDKANAKEEVSQSVREGGQVVYDYVKKQLQANLKIKFKNGRERSAYIHHVSQLWMQRAVTEAIRRNTTPEEWFQRTTDPSQRTAPEIMTVEVLPKNIPQHIMDKMNDVDRGLVENLKDKNTTIERFLREYENQRDQIYNGHLDYLGESGGKGVTQGQLVQDESGNVTDRLGRTSNNPKWYRDHYAKTGKAPTKEELANLATKHLTEGYEDDTGPIPANADYTEALGNIEYLTRLKDRILEELAKEPLPPPSVLENAHREGGPRLNDEVAGAPDYYQYQNLEEWEARTRTWMEKNGYSKEQIEAHLGAVQGTMNIIHALEGIDRIAFPEGAGLTDDALGDVEHPTGGPMRRNSEDIYKTSFDASALCVKRLEAGATAAYIQEKLNRGLSPSERVAMLTLFKAAGKEAPCIYCYVEAMRAKAVADVNKALNFAFGEMPPKKSWSPDTKAMMLAAREEVKRLGLKREDINPNALREIDPAFALTEAAVAKRESAPLLYLYLKKTALSTKANLPKLYEEYVDQILHIKQEVIDELNKIAGLRFFSSSDFQAAHVIDLMQAFHDMDVRQAKAHAYTKVEDFVKIFGNTGMKIQTSIFAKHDKDGNIIPDTWQGMDWTKAQNFRKQYAHVGTVLVATSDDILEWGLAQKWIDYIIPYHASGLEKKIADELGWTDYTKLQNEKWMFKDPTRITKVDKEKGITKKDIQKPVTKMFELGMSKGTTNKKGTEAYLKRCLEKKVIPVFLRFAFEDGVLEAHYQASLKGKRVRKYDPQHEAKKIWFGWVQEGKIDYSLIKEDYIKLRKDYARTDTPFVPVKANFNMAEVDRILKEYADGKHPTDKAPDREIGDRLIEMIERYEKLEKQDIGLDSLDMLENGLDPFTGEPIKEHNGETDSTYSQSPISDARRREILANGNTQDRVYDALIATLDSYNDPASQALTEMAKQLKPKKSYQAEYDKRGVGKFIDGNRYVHVSAIDELNPKERELVDQAYAELEQSGDDPGKYNIIKVLIDGKPNAKTPDKRTVTFLAAPDWDTASEPAISEWNTVTFKGDQATLAPTQGRVQNPQIYHQKYAFVKPDYAFQGLSVDEERQWVERWKNSALPEAKMISRIGNQVFWHQNVLAALADPEFETKLAGRLEQEYRSYLGSRDAIANLRPWGDTQQQVDSAETSINENKLPAAYGNPKYVKMVKALPAGATVVDYGAGKFDNAKVYFLGGVITEVRPDGVVLVEINNAGNTETVAVTRKFLENKGYYKATDISVGTTVPGVAPRIRFLAYDRYNRTQAENETTIKLVSGGKADLVFVNNVNNVIQEATSRAQAYINMADLLKPEGVAFITPYTGDESGVGYNTQKGKSWQNNRPAAGYLPEVGRYFGNINSGEKTLEARMPRKDVISGQAEVLYQAPTFHLKLRRWLENQKQEKFTIDQFKAMAQKSGIKADELYWTGVLQFLEGKEKVTRQEILDHLAAEGEVRVQVEPLKQIVDDSPELNALQKATDQSKEAFDSYFNRFLKVIEESDPDPENGVPLDLELDDWLFKQRLAEQYPDAIDPYSEDRQYAEELDLLEQDEDGPDIVERNLSGLRAAGLDPSVLRELDRQHTANLHAFVRATQERDRSITDRTKFGKYTVEGADRQKAQYNELLIAWHPQEMTIEEYAKTQGYDWEEFQAISRAWDDQYEATYNEWDVLRRKRDELSEEDPEYEKAYNEASLAMDKLMRVKDAGQQLVIEQHKIRAGYEKQKSKSSFQSGHWDQKNVLAHLRVTERTDAQDGSAVLFVEEFQSDWAQKGRKEGFVGVPYPQEKQAKYDEVAQKMEDTEDAIDKAQAEGDRDLVQTLRETHRELARSFRKLLKEKEKYDHPKINQGPFVLATEKWLTLALKQAIRYAAERNADKVAIATGTQNADHYSLRDHITSLQHRPVGSGMWQVVAYNGEQLIMDNELDSDELEQYLGEEMAERIMEAEPLKSERYTVDYREDVEEWQVWDTERNQIMYTSQHEPAALEQADWYNSKAEIFHELTGMDLDAGGKGMKGFYDEVVPTTVAKFLKPFGIKLETIDVGHGPQVGFALTPELKQVAMEEGFPLFQDQSPRGQVQFGSDGPILSLFQGADASTLIHESAHIWFEDMHNYLQSGQADARHIEDWRTLQKWFISHAGKMLRNIKDADPAVYEEIKALGGEAYLKDMLAGEINFKSKAPVDRHIIRQMHEQFASGFEKYVMEGKAPSQALQRAFASFRRWLVKIYQMVTGMDVELNDDVRKVMDRMLASDAEITQQEQIMRLKGQPNTGDPTADELYEDLKMQAHELAIAQLYKNLVAEISEGHGKFLEKVEAAALKASQQRLAGEPLYRATTAIAARYDIDPKQYAADLLDEENYPDPTFRDEADQIAQDHGFSGWNEMAQKIQDNPSLDEAIADEVTTHMAGYNSLMESEEFAERARETAHNELSLDVLNLEKVIFENLLHGRQDQRTSQAKKPGDARKAMYEIVKYESRLAREKARKILAGKTRREATATVAYFGAEKRWAVEAEKALQAGDYVRAAECKRRQIINHALAMEALSNRQEFDRVEKFINTLAKRNPRKLSMPMRFHSQIDLLLKRFGLIDREVAWEVDDQGREKKETLKDFLDSMKEDYYTLLLPKSITDPEGDPKPFSELTLGETRDLYVALRTLSSHGRKNAYFKGLWNKVAVQEAADECAKSIAENVGVLYNTPEIGSSHKSVWGDRLEALFHLPDAGMTWLVKVETVCRFLDGGQDNGPVWKYVYRPIQDAENIKIKLETEAIEKLQSIIGRHYSPQEMRGLEKPQNQYWFEFPGKKPFRFNKKEILLMALNWGNDGNRQRVMAGSKLTEDQVVAILDKLTKDDWDMVQELWDFIDTYWPQVKQLENEVGNSDPEKVRATQVQTKFGVYAGGYYPIKYDPKKSQKIFAYEEELNKLYKEQPTGRAMTIHGHTEARVEQTSYSLLYDWLSLTNHLRNVTHDLSHRRAIIDVSRLLHNDDFKAAVQGAIGIENYGMFEKWLRAVATDQGETLNPGDRGLRFCRQRQTIVVMGLNLLMLSKDFFSNPVMGMWELGNSPAVLRAYLSYMFKPGHGKKVHEIVMSKSVYMQQRAKNRDRDIYDFSRRMFKEDKGLQQWFMQVNGLCDELYSIPSWLERYTKAIAEGADEATAVALADDMVTHTFGSGSKKDLSLAQRGPEWQKSVTMFYSWMNMMYNRMWLSGKLGANEMRHGRSANGIRIMGRAFIYGFVLTNLMEFMVESFAKQGQDDGEDDLTKKLLNRAANFIFGMVPYVRDAGRFLVDKAQGEYANYRISPIESIPNDGIAQPIMGFAQGDMEKIAKGLSYWVGYPAQINKLVFNLVDVMMEDGGVALQDLLVRRKK